MTRSSSIGLRFRDDDRAPFWRNREWWLAPTIRGRYLSTIAKGWWLLGPSSITKHFELEVAIGGEDNMLQAGIILPYLGRVHVGLRVPRWATRGWIYERREWTLRIGYIGRWVELLFASDEHMRDTGMASYYREKRKQPADCETCGHYASFHADPVLVPPYSVKSLDDVERLTKRIPNPEGRCITGSELNHGCAPCKCTGYVPAKPTWNRLQLWPGLHLTFDPHLRDRLLGRMECTTTTGDPEPIVVPMPEGNYPGKVRREDRVWRRKRWPFSEKRRTDYWIEMDIGVPCPGKGENSWDCEDDAIYGTGGKSIHDAVANVTRGALRQREMYAGKGWAPDAGWPEGVAR